MEDDLVLIKKKSAVASICQGQDNAYSQHVEELLAST